MSTSRRAPAGASLIHPFSLVCLGVLVVNDHWLKRAWPGFVTGKLSDFAGVFLLPLFLQALLELAYGAFARGARLRSNWPLWVGILVSALVFGAAELGGVGDTVYRYGAGALQWPFLAAWAALRGLPAPPLRPVAAIADLTDLSALSMLLVAYRVGRQRAPRPRLATLPVFVLALLLAPTRAAAAERTHDGLYLSFKATPGGLFLNSNASVSNGFQQPIPSTARGFAFPAGALEVGGTLPDGLVLGGRIVVAQTIEPNISTLGETFRVRNFGLTLLAIQALTRYYPDPSKGLHFGGGLGLFSIESMHTYPGSEMQRGYCLSLEGGHDFWIGRQWSFGLDAGIFLGRSSGEVGGSTVIMPTAGAAFVLH